MTSGIVVRQVEVGDANVVADLMTQLGYPTEPREMERRLQSILARPDYHAAVATVDGSRVVGVVGACWSLFFERTGRYGRVTLLVVDERHRNRGIGSALLREAERWLASQDTLSCVINSSNHREGAHRFYERSGYVATGRRFSKELVRPPA